MNSEKVEMFNGLGLPKCLEDDFCELMQEKKTDVELIIRKENGEWE